MKTKHMNISEKAIEYVQKNKKKLIEEFCPKNIYKSFPYPTSIFMAGSPGAGKTEFSKKFIDHLVEAMNRSINNKESVSEKFTMIRIDPDEFREKLPGYNGSNSDLFQGAVTRAVEKILDYTLHNKINFLLDGTFAKENVVLGNIKRCIDKSRTIQIIYKYQDPILAWKLTKAREYEEGRKIPLTVFIDDLFQAKDNVNKIKKLYKNKINVTLLEVSYENPSNNRLELNIDNIDNYLKIKYNKDELKKILEEV